MKKSNNKGFTLVELIIVVAIIAVLAAVLAPQYLRYVERARQSNDLQVATSIMRAATAAISDPQVGTDGVASNSTVTVTWTTTGTTNGLAVTGTQDAATNTALLNEIAQTMGWWSGTAVAGVDDAQSAAGNGVNFVFTISASTGQITIAKASGAWATEVGVSQPVSTT